MTSPADRPAAERGEGVQAGAGAARRRGGAPTGRTVAALCFAIACVLGALPLHAQEKGESSFGNSPTGSPRFTQVLRWQADPNVLFYEVTVQAASGEAIQTFRLAKPLLELNLRPGEYRYRIVLYNLLGKPELSVPWRRFTVRRAESPRITSVSRQVWFVDELEPQLTLRGEELAPGATVVLRPADPAAPPIAGVVLEQEGQSTVRVRFPEEGITAGEYSLIFTNPGGLSFTVPRAIRVRSHRPLDLFLCAGYAPWIGLYDEWYLKTWQGSFSLLNAMARLSAYFVKRPYGDFGAEVTVKGQLSQGGAQGATVVSTTGMAGLEGIYRYPFSRRLALAARAGGGLSLSHFVFKYEAVSGPEISTANLYVTAGVSLQYFLTKRLFLEAGSDWLHLFTKGYSEGGIAPFLMAGTQF